MSHDEHVDCDKQIAALTAELEAKDKEIERLKAAGRKFVKVLKKQPLYKKAIMEAELQNCIDEGIKKFTEMITEQALEQEVK